MLTGKAEVILDMTQYLYTPTKMSQKRFYIQKQWRLLVESNRRNDTVTKTNDF